MKLTKTQIVFAIAVAMGLAILFFVPAANGLTPQGVRFLAVFIPTIFIWLVEGGSGWTALLGVSLLVMLGAWEGPDSYEKLWGGSMVAMIIPYYMIANALEESGAVMWVVRWILSRKIVHGRPNVFSIMFLASIVLVSVFITPIVTVVIFFKVLKDLTETIGMDRNSGFYKAHGLFIGWLSQIADGCLIWGRPFVLSMVAIIVGLGFDKFTMNDFFKLSAIYLIFACVAAFLIMKFWIRPDTEAFQKFDDEAIRDELKANPMTKRAKVLLVSMLFVIFAYVAAFCTPLGAVQVYFNGLPVAAPISFVVALLAAAVTLDGKPVMDLGKEMARLPWNAIMFLGSVMFFGGIVGNEAFGISEMLTNVLGPVVANLPAMAAILLGLFLASVMTNLTSNAVSAMVVLSCFTPAMLAAPNISNAQVLAFCACVVMVCATAIATLAACATMSVVYCPEGIEYKGTARYSIALCAALVVLSTFILVPLGSVFFGGLV